MASLVFLVLHALKQLHLDYDSYIFCLLLSLDTLSLVQFLRWRAYLKR